MELKVESDQEGQAVLMTITPEMAKAWLGDMFTYQRKLKRLKQQQFAKDIATGKWKVNGETIIISNETKPKVLDGQHRLRACIQVDMPFRSWVITGMDPLKYDSMDQGTARSTVDLLDIDSKVAGRESSIRNIAKVAATAALCFEYERGSFRRFRPLPRDVKKYLNENPELEQWVSDAMSGGSRATNNYSAFIAAVSYLVSGKYPIESKEFLHQFVSNEGLYKGDPVYALRRYLLDDIKKVKSAFSRKNIFIIVAKAWNAFIQKEQVMHYRFQKGFVVLKGGPHINEDNIDNEE